MNRFGIPIYWCNAQHEMYASDDGGWVAVHEYEKLFDAHAATLKRLAEIAQIIEQSSDVYPSGKRYFRPRVVDDNTAERIYRLAKGEK